MLNICTIMGRLTRDPEVHELPSGTKNVTFTLACDRDYVGKDGNRETDFIDIVDWRNPDFVKSHFTKGSRAIVTGRLQFRSWTDKDGNSRRSAEINADSVYFGDSKRSDAPSA